MRSCLGPAPFQHLGGGRQRVADKEEKQEQRTVDQYRLVGALYDLLADLDHIHHADQHRQHGAGAGLRGDRSGTFWPFWKLIKALGDEDRAPRLVVLENVCGALSSHDGKDFAAISSALSNNGYRFGAVVINAVHFLPQSRPRLFIIGVRKSSPSARISVRPWCSARVRRRHNSPSR